MNYFVKSSRHWLHCAQSTGKYHRGLRCATRGSVQATVYTACAAAQAGSCHVRWKTNERAAIDKRLLINNSMHSTRQRRGAHHSVVLHLERLEALVPDVAACGQARKTNARRVMTSVFKITSFETHVNLAAVAPQTPGFLAVIFPGSPGYALYPSVHVTDG